MSKSRVLTQTNERLEPLLGYCSNLMANLTPEDSSRLTENLLTIMQDLRPFLKEERKASPLSIEFLER